MKPIPLYVNGVLVQFYISEGLVVKVVIPAIRDQFGEPQTITYDPGFTIQVVIEALQYYLAGGSPI